MSNFYNEDGSLKKLKDEQRDEALDYINSQVEKMENFLEEKEELIPDAYTMESTDDYEKCLEDYEEEEDEAIREVRKQLKNVHKVEKAFETILEKYGVFNIEAFDNFFQDIKKDRFDDDELEEYMNDYL